MIVDASALIAVLQGEPQANEVIDALDSADTLTISAATLLEASIVADGTGDPVRSARFDALLAALELEVAPVTAEQVAIARRAYRSYGRGSGHPAGLNYGDCFSYALAIERDEPLLFVGSDFSRTDVRPVLPVSRP